MNEQEKIYIISTKDKDIRIDKWLTHNLPEISRTKIKDLLNTGLIKVNNNKVKANYKTCINDTIYISKEYNNTYSIVPSPGNLDILYEDKDIIVVNKPAGVTVHPGAGFSESDTSLVHHLLYHIKLYAPLANNLRPGVIHRLDKDTSGILVWAKNTQTTELIAKQFKEKTTKRKYISLLDGFLEHTTQEVISFIGRDKNFRTRYR